MIFKQGESRRYITFGPIEGADKLPEAEGVKTTGDTVRFAKSAFADERECEEWLRKNTSEDVLHVKTLAAATSALELDDAEWAEMTKYITNPDNVKREDFRVYRSWLANSVIDRDRERFPVHLLKQFADTLPGKSKIFNHNWWSGEPAGRYYSAEVKAVTLEEMIEMCGNVPVTNFRSLVKRAEQMDGGLYWLVGKYYVPANDKELIFKIDSGLLSFESIGFRAPDLEQIEDDNGNTLWWEWQADGTRTGEATEGSWVFLGSQYGARTGKSANVPGQVKGLTIEDVEDVIETAFKRFDKQTRKETGTMKVKLFGKSFELDPENLETVQTMTEAVEAKFAEAEQETETLRDEKAAMKKVLDAAGFDENTTEDQAKVIAEDAKAYRDSVIEDAMKYGQLVEAIPTDEEEAKTHRETIEKLGTEEIKRTAEGYKKIWQKNNPPEGQIKTEEGDEGEKKEPTFDPEAPNAYTRSMPV